MSYLRMLARGKPCQIRLAGICNHNDETTVLAHFRMAGICGMGLKVPDLIGSWACSACHDAVDGRAKVKLSRAELRLSHLEGVARTQAMLIHQGVVKW